MTLSLSSSLSLSLDICSFLWSKADSPPINLYKSFLRQNLIFSCSLLVPRSRFQHDKIKHPLCEELGIGDKSLQLFYGQECSFVPFRSKRESDLSSLNDFVRLIEMLRSAGSSRAFTVLNCNAVEHKRDLSVNSALTFASQSLRYWLGISQSAF